MTRALLTGRISGGPDPLLDEEILAPQFEFEMAHLLPWYLLIEKVLVLEYRRLGLLDKATAGEIGTVLHGLCPADLRPDRERNLSDPAFAIERHVARSLAAVPVTWHVDRSRNDLQAAAQLMAVRPMVLDAVEGMLVCAEKAGESAARLAGFPMPGYTQLQPAQAISPGFHLSALADQVLAAAARLLRTYDEVNLCPLGAGAMAGQELPFDREVMARRCGFAAPQPHALVSVASRGWALYLAADVSVLGVTLSRFVTDLMGWTGGDCGYLVLPDRLAGISSAMPQKRNHPVLERIRGRTAHLTSAYQDVALSQRNTPFSNMVEVSKESTVAAYGMFDMLGSVLRLLTEVLGSLEADPSRAAERCAAEHLGAFTLANRLTLELGVPWRDAQVAVGRYIAAHVRGAALVDSAELLADALAEIGHPTAARTDIGFRLPVEGDELLNAKVTPGSTNPAAVAAMLSEQAERAAGLRTEIRRRAEEVSVARREVDESLGVGGLDGAAR